VIFGSVCSGIGAAELAWSRIGWRCAWSAEIDPFPSRVLAQRFPGVPNLGDFTKIGSDVGAVDVLVGGTPCQSFSSAGGRAGLDDPRGNLAIEFVRLARRVRARWIVWENVPGVLTTNGGRDFGAFLGTLEDGGFLTRAARRGRRLPPPARASAPRGLDPSPALTASAGSSRKLETPMSVAPLLASQGRAGNVDTPMIVGSLLASAGRSTSSVGPVIAHALTAPRSGQRLDATVETFAIVPIQEAQGATGSQRGAGVAEAGAPMYTLGTRGDHAVAFHATQPTKGRAPVAPTLSANARSQVGVMSFDEQQITHRENRAKVEPGAPAPALCQAGRIDVAGAGLAPRRLTPREWERLQGFPDDWTLIAVGAPKRNRAAPLAKDTVRYKAIGNSMAVPVMRWIGERIDLVDRIGDRA
jgi:DNA (cytosine-5)-methyltransferase 1